MTPQALPEIVYVGLTEKMVAEVSSLDPAACDVGGQDYRYSVMGYGDAQFDTEFARTKKAAKAIAKEWQAAAGGRSHRVGVVMGFSIHRRTTNKDFERMSKDDLAGWIEIVGFGIATLAASISFRTEPP